MDSLKIFFISAIVLLLYFAAEWVSPHAQTQTPPERALDVLTQHPAWYSTSGGSLKTFVVSDIVKPTADSGGMVGTPGTLKLTIHASGTPSGGVYNWRMDDKDLSLSSSTPTRPIIVHYISDSKLNILGLAKDSSFETFHPGTRELDYVAATRMTSIAANAIIGGTEYVKKLTTPSATRTLK